MRIGADDVCWPTISSDSSTGMPAWRNDESWRENAMTTSGLIVLADAEQRLLDLRLPAAPRRLRRRGRAASLASAPSASSGCTDARCFAPSFTCCRTVVIVADDGTEHGASVPISRRIADRMLASNARPGNAIVGRSAATGQRPVVEPVRDVSRRCRQSAPVPRYIPANGGPMHQR